MPLDFVECADNFENFDGVYPDNVQVVAVFASMLTQWRYGGDRVTGLDHSNIEFVYRVRKVKPEDEEEVFDLFLIMEQAALRAIRGKGG